MCKGSDYFSVVLLWIYNREKKTFFGKNKASWCSIVCGSFIVGLVIFTLIRSVAEVGANFHEQNKQSTTKPRTTTPQAPTMADSEPFPTFAALREEILKDFNKLQAERKVIADQDLRYKRSRQLMQFRPRLPVIFEDLVASQTPSYMRIKTLQERFDQNEGPSGDLLPLLAVLPPQHDGDGTKASGGRDTDEGSRPVLAEVKRRWQALTDKFVRKSKLRRTSSYNSIPQQLANQEFKYGITPGSTRRSGVIFLETADRSKNYLDQPEDSEMEKDGDN